MNTTHLANGTSAPGSSAPGTLVAPLRPTPPPDDTVSGASAPTARPTPSHPAPPPKPWLARSTATAAHLLGRRGVGPRSLAIFAGVFALTALLVFAIGHWGIAAILGLVAVAAASLSVVPTESLRPTTDSLARMLAPLFDLMMTGGVVGALATVHPPLAVLLGVVVFVLRAWLLRVGPLPAGVHNAGVGGPDPEPACLWTPRQGTVVLLIGALVGRPVPALLACALILAAEATLHVVQVLRIPSLRSHPLPVPSWAGPFLGTDGRFTSLARWGTFGLTVLLLFAVPLSSLWRF